jgi:hypothetical protein
MLSKRSAAISLISLVRRLLRFRPSRRKQMEREMDEEFHFHLQMEIEKNLKAGLSPKEARRRALISFGGVDIAKEKVREDWNRLF